jgi:hypothetical protein
MVAGEATTDSCHGCRAFSIVLGVPESAGTSEVHLKVGADELTSLT